MQSVRFVLKNEAENRQWLLDLGASSRCGFAGAYRRPLCRSLVDFPSLLSHYSWAVSYADHSPQSLLQRRFTFNIDDFFNNIAWGLFMEWLHFSDFHVGRTANPQAEALGTLIDFINDDLKDHPGNIDAIFLVGDIAYSGQQPEYLQFEDIFLKPLRSIPSIRNAKIYAVPGNHDVDCEASTPTTWDAIRERKQQVYFCEDDEGRKVRADRTKVFHEYWEFVQRNGIVSPNPFAEVSTFLTDTALPFDILSMNTSFFSDKEDKSDEPITPCPLSALRERLRGLERRRPLILLGHHSINSFLREHQKHFETLLTEKMAVYLHGHEHEPKLSCNTNGTVRSIGFGAAYIKSLGQPAHAPYRNSFARCRVDDRLHLRGFSWDYSLGKWSDATRSQYCLSAENYDGDCAVLDIPLLTQSPSRSSHPTLRVLPRKSPQPQAIIPVAPSDKLWLRLVALGDNFATNYRDNAPPNIQSQKHVDGKSEIVTETANKRDLLVCIPGPTHILSSKEIESYNTRLDTEDFRSVTVLSLGKISTEARDMYLRLKARKSIEVLVNQELTEKWPQLLSSKQMEGLASLDAGTVTANVLVDENAIQLLLLESTDGVSFRIVDESGNTLPASHALVAKLRDSHPSFAKMLYTSEQSRAENIPALLDFDEGKYLHQCYQEYNAIRYAALANIGIRLSDLKLEDVYIDASACAVDTGNVNRISALLDDHLAAYPASETLKAQIKQRLLDQLDDQSRQETSQAREFCQQFGAVLLTGDPGSGKTCFVKSEILAYCRRVTQAKIESGQISADEWHQVHVPVMIPLSQAAAEADLDSQGLLVIASRLLERRGFYFPSDKMTELLRQGRLALFFDGLDEVVSVERRALVVQQINSIVDQSLRSGNRIVVTSRPAAVNVVNLLPALRVLELQGLTDTEIRKLANRILSLRLADSPDGLVVDVNDHRDSDSPTVKQLMQDCADKPGVARFATNPLLLTLLVMIYANSGPLSAKRHRIYEEAVRTLASVRGRQVGQDPVSVQDLRERLGAVALSVYKKESGLLPTRREVSEIVKNVMTRQTGQPASAQDADSFIQRVAESTGLIAVGGDGGSSDDNSIVTFMHHSFMEYFAAVALSRELDSCDVSALVTEPRWIEILTLLGGIIGERTDIAPVLSRFVGDGTHFGDVDARYVLFALDCALECEVPSEAAIKLLLKAISACVEQGPARSDPWVRSELGHRMAQLIASCGEGLFEPILVQLIRNSNGDTSAAGISLAGYACAGESKSTEIRKAIDCACARKDENILCAICEVASKVDWFRTPSTLQVIAICLGKTKRCKRSAFEAILAIPGLAVKHWAEIINGMDDDSPLLRRLASKAAVKAGLDSDLAAIGDTKKNIVANALKFIRETGAAHEYPSAALREDTIEHLMNSGILRDRLIGIQMIPALRTGGDIIHEKLMRVLDDSDDHQELTAALGALRSSPDARVLFTVSDIKRIAALLDTGTADVRKASIHLLGCFGGSEDSVKTLLQRDVQAISSSEYEAVFAALGRAQVLQDDVIRLVEAELDRWLGAHIKLNEEYVVAMCALLESARCLGKNLRPDISTSIRLLVGDYKQDLRVRRVALRAYPIIAVPTSQLVQSLTDMFTSPPVNLHTELILSLSSLAENCRQSVEHVMACVDSMSGLRMVAIEMHKSLSKRDVTSDNEFLVTELREGIHEISELIITFEEFIRRDQSPRVASGSLQ